MKRLLYFLAILIGISACCITKHTSPQTNTVTQVHLVDSIVWHDSTLYHNMYKEYYNDYTALLDTLKLETTYSGFTAYVDTTNKLLKGKAENKSFQLPIEIKWKERITYKDSIQIKEIPHEVEVTKEITKYPKSYWWFLGFTILALVYLGLKIYLKIKFGKII